MTRGGVGAELRREVFPIAVDSTTVGSINRHDTIETLPDSGPHTGQLGAGLYGR
jgi:hypothetical protein